MVDYPERESHFAHKLTRLLWRTCAAHEIGLPAAFLVIQIAHTEDAKRYSGPVTYWNDQLQSLMGLSWDQLNRIRKKAVEDGWLHYEPGRKGKAGKYWSTVPSRYDMLPDGPVDEDFVRTNAGESAEEYAEESADENAFPPHTCGEMFRRKPDESSEHSTLTLNPSPKKNKAFDPLSLALPFPSDAFRQSWGDFCQSRKSIKPPLTEVAASRLLKKCERWGEETAIAAIDASIENGWKGLFEPKRSGPRAPERVDLDSLNLED